MVVSTEKYTKDAVEWINKRSIELIITDEHTLTSMGSLDSNNTMLATASMIQHKNLPFNAKSFSLALDDIRDPGNLGTIIRTADWFGIHSIYCSENTTDFYSPKVIASTMGSFTRVNLEYCNLEKKVKDFKNNGLAIYGAFMDGLNIKSQMLKPGILVMGNESKGINPTLGSLIDQKISIQGKGNAESLNVAVATGIILHQLID